MKKISDIILLNRNFFIGYLLFVISAILFLSLTPKVNGFLWMNSYHNKSLDLFFEIYTNVGDGLFSLSIFILLLVLRKPLPAWEIIFAFLLAGLMVQIVKNIFPMPRPKTLLESTGYSHFIDGVTLVGNASFPSGHTASAFATATILSIFTKNKKISLLYLLAALLVAYSRIYLAQHFLQDVLCGSLIGIIAALIAYSRFEKTPAFIEKLKFSRKEKVE